MPTLLLNSYRGPTYGVFFKIALTSVQFLPKIALTSVQFSTKTAHNIVQFHKKTYLCRQARFARRSSSTRPRSLCSVTTSPVSDFLIDAKYTFEVGGKKKRQRQLQSIENGYVVKDDIETGYGNIIPLWMFGMLY